MQHHGVYSEMAHSEHRGAHRADFREQYEDRRGLVVFVNDRWCNLGDITVRKKSAVERFHFLLAA